MAFFNSKNVDVAFKKYQIKYFIIILLATSAILCTPFATLDFSAPRLTAGTILKNQGLS